MFYNLIKIIIIQDNNYGYDNYYLDAQNLMEEKSWSSYSSCFGRCYVIKLYYNYIIILKLYYTTTK
jgi:hypothetical protein